MLSPTSSRDILPTNQITGFCYFVNKNLKNYLQLVELDRMLKFFVIFCFCVVGQALTPSSFLTTVEKSRLKDLFEASLHQETPHSILGLKLLGGNSKLNTDLEELCKRLQTEIDGESVTISDLFKISLAANSLESCSLKLNSHASQVMYRSVKFI